METKKPKTRKKTKYIFSYEIAKIKRQNLFFSVTYCEAGSLETYTDVLRWSEIKKPSKNIVVLKMEVLKKKTRF